MVRLSLPSYLILVLTFIMIDGIQSLKVQINAAQASYKAADTVNIVLQYENDQSTPVYIRPMYFPDGVMYEDILNVTLDDVPLEYHGRLAKRPTATINTCIEVKPGESVKTTVDISRDYNLTRSGTYVIGLKGNAETVLLHVEGKNDADGEKSDARLAASEALVSIEGREYILPHQEASSRLLRKMFNCTTSQKTSINQAFTVARTYASNSLTYLTKTTSGKRTRYVTWFGKYTATRWTTITVHYRSLVNSFKNNPYDIDCTCKDAGIYAYVYPSYPYVIYVCGAFWSTTTSGTDSRAGTLIHEASHFTAVIGTDDYVYGQAGCKDLAISNPDVAIWNADSHEYFAENTPALS